MVKLSLPVALPSYLETSLILTLWHLFNSQRSRYNKECGLESVEGESCIERGNLYWNSNRYNREKKGKRSKERGDENRGHQHLIPFTHRTGLTPPGHPTQLVGLGIEKLSGPRVARYRFRSRRGPPISPCGSKKYYKFIRSFRNKVRKKFKI